MHRRGVGAGAIAKKKLAEASYPIYLIYLYYYCVVWLWAVLMFLCCVFVFLSVQAKYKERGNVIAEDQIAQVRIWRFRLQNSEKMCKYNIYLKVFL